MIRILILLFFSIHSIGIHAYAQGKKSIVKNKIKSITENVTFYENTKEISYKDYYILYNKRGEILIETNYNKNGSIKKQETFQYANGKNKTEETIYRLVDENQKKETENKRITSKYNADNDKIEEVEYDGSGKVIKKVLFAYNNLGEKNSEIHSDGSGLLKKKILYTYDGKGLRVKRVSYLPDNTLESIKKYTYEFY